MNWKNVLYGSMLVFLIYYIGKKKIKYIMYKSKEELSTPYINQPLRNQADDQIGIAVYVEKIKQAITAGAEIIAIASDFGTGKSSLISLLEKEYGIVKRTRYKFSTINLWGFVKPEDDVTEIHRNFIYQLVSHLNPQRGSHLSKRMSKNFGVLRLGIGSPIMMLLAFVALLFLLMAEMIRRYTEVVTEYIINFIPSISESYMLRWSVFCYFFFVIILFYIITRTDVVFSSPKSEGNREIDENIIMDYYKMQVLNKGICKHYVVIIEDLDRISNPQVIFDFLIELHKYYIPEYDNRFWKCLKNKVTFIVCIKPAAQLQNELNEWIKNIRETTDDNVPERPIHMQEIYSKIFDLIIELKRINIDNYDSILRGLLEEKRGYLYERGLLSNIKDDLFSVEGIQWIIRGEELSIREIKQRLNDAFILYEVLIRKFAKSNIEFSKCIIASYLTNAFPKDMLNIRDNTFDNCINSYIKGEKEYSVVLEGCTDEFINTIMQLIEGKQIQADYRVYFYNYPKNSYLYDMFELKVINTLLYDSVPERDFEFALEMTGEKHILYAINKIHDLKIALPKVALKYKKILKIVLESYPKMIVEYIREVLDYSENEMARTTSEIQDIFRLLLEFEDSSGKVIDDIMEVWNDNISKKSLLEIRTMLCKEYRESILKFDSLFQQNNPLITMNEVQLINDNNKVIASLINFDSLLYDDYYFEKLSDIFLLDTLQDKVIQSFYIRSYEVVTKEVVIKRVFVALEKERILPPAIDDILYKSVLEDVCSTEEYVGVLETKELLEKSIENIHELAWSNGLAKMLCDALYKKAYYLDYVINLAVKYAEEIDLTNENILFTVKNYASEILERNKVAFANLRIEILRSKLENQYIYVFEKPYRGISQEELTAIDDVDREINLMEKNPPEVTIDSLVEHFNKRYQDSRKTARIIDFIYNMCATSQEFATAFYKLDMDNVRFRKMSKTNISRIVSNINMRGMLSTTAQKLKFMKFVNILLQELEKAILKDVVVSKEYEDEYVELINLVGNATKQTMENMKSFKYMHSYCDAIDTSLLKEKRYKSYLYSVTIKNKYFTMPENQELILAAEEIFIANRWDNMIRKMCSNNIFMNRMIEKEIYKDEPTTRMRFATMNQNSEMIRDLFLKCNEEEIISYLCKINGFKDYEAAKDYVEIIEKKPKVLLNQNVYDHTHHLLIDPYLKGRYTKARNAAISK